MNRLSSRLLQLLLCGLLLCSMSQSARAVARPENRVWNFFSDPQKTASEIASQPVDTRRENPGYGYDFASGVRIYLYCHDNPVMGLDPSGNKTVVVVNDSGNPGAFEKHSADSAAGHLKKAGWTVIYKETSEFINYTNSFEGVIFTGHGDKNMAAAFPVSALEYKLKETHSQLDVGIALTCHGFDFISTVSRDGYTTPTALVIGYWGYAINNYDHRVRVGRAIDKWVANPTYTSISMGNLLTDGAGQAGMGIAHVADVMIQIINLGPMF